MRIIFPSQYLVVRLCPVVSEMGEKEFFLSQEEEPNKKEMERMTGPNRSVDRTRGIVLSQYSYR
jgi:hypothetical protein